jgi:hypothetical protein
MNESEIAHSYGERITAIVDQNVDPMQLDPIPSDLPEDTKYLGDRLDQVIALLTDIQQATQQQQSPSSGMFFLFATRNDFPQFVRVRCIALVVGSSAAGNVTLQVGTASVLVINFPAADTKVIPLPITIDVGKDVTLVAAGGAAITAGFLTGYAESDRPS